MPADKVQQSHPDQKQGLRRGLRAVDVAMMGLSAALGTGLFLGSRDVIEVAGIGALFSYIIATAMAGIVIYAMGEITIVHPHAGGFGESAHYFVGPCAGFMARWNVAVASCIAVGIEITAAAGYVVIIFPGLPLIIPVAAISAAVLLMCLTAVRFYGLIQTTMTTTKILVVVLFVIAGLVLILFGTGQVQGHPIGLSNITNEPIAPHGMIGLLLGVSVAIFSFGGIESSSVAAGESQDPATAIPRATRIMIVTLFIADIGSLFVVLGLLPVDTLLASDPHQSPFVTVLKVLGVPAAGNIMNVLLILAALSSAMGLMYAASRMLLSLAGEGLAPGMLGHVRRDGVPQHAVFAAASGMVIAMLATVLSPDHAFLILLGILVFGVVVTWSLVLLTHVCMRRSQSHDARQSQMSLPGGSATSGLVLAMMPLVALSLWWIPGQRVALIVGIPYLASLYLAAHISKRSTASQE